jgi:beta-glucosidase/6-phospho-beta-glucosidase/beta-galactosidase|eukprot:TRINITY_DN2483_c0_g1_i3.p1 TRINITY_DN2483_c0_g1~~TRINITY_DN2483_c0_g1_i3.p1  ORF type:complete len:525 (+),score=70.79 TRINITY_DN2483_c0_g1_i3:65-1639(+)
MRGALAAVLGSVVYAGTPSSEDVILKAFQGERTMLWGAATAAAQVEGAWNVSGKQPSIWDDFCKSVPAMTGDTSDGVLPRQCGHGDFISNLDVTDDFYHKYNADLDMLASMGFTSLRVSISWPRVMPLVNGRHRVSREGMQFYRDVFNGMKKRGITPVVTLFHWDLPNDLSWLQESVVNEFVMYADEVFSYFSDVVKHWATFNEPASFCNLGYSTGNFAPGHKSKKDHLICSHHVLQAHAKTVSLYRRHYQRKYHGKIGIVLDYKWAYPATDSEDDKRAASYDRDRVFGIWADPIFLTGDYPQSLKDFWGEHMPTFTAKEKRMLKGSADFYGVNSYGGKVAIWTNKTYDDVKDGDNLAEMYSFSPCDASAPEEAQKKVKDPATECGADSNWLWAKPESMREYLEFVHDRYKLETIYVTEFGCDVKNESFIPKEQALKDPFREWYYKSYLAEIAKAKLNGVPIKGVFAWSLMDNLEWGDGLAFRFGLVYVDFKDSNLPRTPKTSAKWWSTLLGKMMTPRMEEIVL